MATPTHDATEVGERYGHSRAYVLEQARRGNWPHLKVGRSVKFTDAHLAAIDAMHEVKAKQSVAAASWGRRTR